MLHVSMNAYERNSKHYIPYSRVLDFFRVPTSAKILGLACLQKISNATPCLKETIYSNLVYKGWKYLWRLWKRNSLYSFAKPISSTSACLQNGLCAYERRSRARPLSRTLPASTAGGSNTSCGSWQFILIKLSLGIGWSTKRFSIKVKKKCTKKMKMT